MALRRAFVYLAPVVILAGLASGVTLKWGWSSLHEPYAAWGGTEVVVDLPHDLGAQSILDRLTTAGVIRRPGLVRAWLVLQGGASGLQAGEYRFHRPASALEVLERLRGGDVILHPVTVPEGLTLEEVARKLVEAGFGTQEALLAIFRDPGPIRELDPAATDLEGYLFPDTYLFPRGAAPASIALAMVKRFLEVTGPDYAARASSVGLTPRQAVTLASLVEEETSLPAERPRISGVFHNRLRRAMPLQCDPTVLYAMRRAGRDVPRLMRGHLGFPSPWNTYREAGLPPGPICSPGKESLAAAVSPAPGDDLYFVASPAGGHRFSRDLTTHTQAVRAWHAYVRSSR